MSNNGSTTYNNLFSSVISEIKSYSGTDPLLPWLRGIRKMKDTLPSELLKEKLPRFLQKCSETFLTERRYANDLRYLRVWLQMMDFVDDPKAVLRKMETNRIGIKKSLFYQAYALYYEKMKKFDAADKIYHLGVQNFAEPADELQKSYEQFLRRMERHRYKKVQHQGHKTDITLKKVVVGGSGVENVLKDVKLEQDETDNFYTDDIVVKLADTAIVGKSYAEDARHHGLVEPTITTREARDAINSMFKEPLEPSDAGRRRGRNQSQIGNSSNNEVKVFKDESLMNEVVSPSQNLSKKPSAQKLECSGDNQPLGESFEIYVDDEETNDIEEKVDHKGIQAQNSRGITISNIHEKPLVFAKPNDLPSEFIKDPNHKSAYNAGLWEDTVVHRFVRSSTILDEPEVENVWHHGLVEPTMTSKEAMNDINSMFGQPIEYVRKSRSKKQQSALNFNNNSEEFLIYPDDKSNNQRAKDDIRGRSQKPLSLEKENNPIKQDKVPEMSKNTGFLILPDDDLDDQPESSVPGSSTENGNDLFEQTICTRQAMDEINKFFSMPLDF